METTNNQTKQRRQTLTAKGYKQIPTTQKWINRNGEILNETKLYSRPTKPKTVIFAGKRWRVEKAILWAFEGTPPRLGYVTHLNGNKADHRPENIKYQSLPDTKTPETVNRQNLCTAIRCYWNIERNAKPTAGEYLTRVHLQYIANRRRYCEANAQKPHFAVFAEWINGNPLTTNAAKVAKQNGLGILDTRRIIARYLNQLTAEICNELEAGKLELQPYHETHQNARNSKPPKPLHRLGCKRPAAVYLPKDILQAFERLGIEPPARPVWGVAKDLPNGAKLIIWLGRAETAIKQHAAQHTNEATAKECGDLLAMIAAKIGKLNFFDNNTKI